MNESLAPTVETTHLLRWSLPPWLTLIIWLALLLAVAVVYHMERGKASPSKRWSLAAIRFALLSIALIMLTNWTIERYESMRPEVLVLVDTSDSMNSPSSDKSLSDPSRLELALQSLDSLSERERMTLQQQFQMKYYSVAETLELLPIDLLHPSTTNELIEKGKRSAANSRLGAGIVEAIQGRAGQEVAAIVLLSDGINTDGPSLSTAAELARSTGIPVFSAITGQLDQSPDLSVSNLQIEKDAFLGDRLTAQLSVQSANIRSSSYRIAVLNAETETMLASSEVRLDGESEVVAELTIEAKDPGRLPLRFTIESAEGEVNLANNSIDTTLQIHDQPLKVLLAFGKPNYEFRFLKDFLERAKTTDGKAVFDLHSVLYSGDAAYVDQDQTAERSIPLFASELQKFDVFLLGPLDYSLVNASTLDGIVSAVNHSGSGCMLICDQEDSIQTLEKTRLSELLPVRHASRKSRRDEFSNVVLSELGSRASPLRVADSNSDSLAIWQSLPPLSNWAQVSSSLPGAQIWLTTNDARTDESFPLLATQYVGRGRVAVQLTDETYRWTNWKGNDVVYQRYWGQMLRWLARGKLTSDGPTMELIVTPQVATEGSTVEFKLLHTPPLAPSNAVDTPIVEIVSHDQSTQSLALTTSQSTNQLRTYSATNAFMSRGSYRAVYHDANGQAIAKDFTIIPNEVEKRSTPIDRSDLEQLSQRTGGELWVGMEQIQQGILHLPKGRTMRINELPPITLWNHPLLVAAFVVLISLEWLLRRQSSML